MRMFKAAVTNSSLPPGTVEFEIDFSNPDSLQTKVLSHADGTNCHTGDDALTLGEFLNHDGSISGTTGHAIPDETATPLAANPQKAKPSMSGPFGQGAFAPGQKAKQKDMTGGMGV